MAWRTQQARVESACTQRTRVDRGTATCGDTETHTSVPSELGGVRIALCHFLLDNHILAFAM